MYIYICIYIYMYMIHVPAAFDPEASDVVPDATSYLQMIRAHVRDPEGDVDESIQSTTLLFYVILREYRDGDIST